METLDIVIIMDIAIGAYLLYAGISGKGNVYQNNRLPDEVQGEAKKLLRVITLILGAILFVSGIFEAFHLFKQEIVMLASIGACVIVLIVYYILCLLYTSWSSFYFIAKQNRSCCPQGIARPFFMGAHSFTDIYLMAEATG